MASFELNGLVDSFMPSIYINKITLEGASAAINKIAANKEAAIEAHIDKRSSDTGGWTGNPTAEDFTESNKLVVTYSLLLEVQDLFDEIGDFVDDIFKYLRVHILTFKNEKGKDAYQHFISKKDIDKFSNTTIAGAINWMDSKKDPSSGLAPWPPYYPTQLENNKDFKYTSRALDNIVENTMSTSATGQMGLQTKREFIKQKYKHVLPNGRIIYKIPVEIKQEIAGTVFPKDLSAIAMCTLNIDTLMNELEWEVGEEFEYWGEKYGRIASSVIIKNSLVPKQGMIFFISTDQDSDKFDKSMGSLWMGGVHKHGDRFMAGNKHDPDVAHPFLDYVLVDNNSVQDFRQISQIKKQIFNFEASKNTFFGGNYINNQLNQVATADFSNLVCFGDLISSINTKRQAKLLFSIDWGKMVKKYCAVPALLDKMSNMDGGAKVTSFLSQNGVPSIKCFKVYRRRVDVPPASDSVNDTTRKLIYDGYPNIYYTGQMGDADITKDEMILQYNPQVKSALSPVFIEDFIFENSANSSHMAYYTFTDYDIQNISKGTFEYSLEVEIEDPTLNYFTSSYKKIKAAISAIKPAVAFVGGGHNPLKSSYGQNALFNSQTGQFTQLAVKIFEDQGWDQLASSNVIISAVQAAIDFTTLAKNKTMINKENLMSLLSVESGTPESFNAFSEILILMADKLKSLVNSYSTVPIPKTLSFTYTAQEGTSPVNAGSKPQRNTIVAQHSFSKLTELVRTTHSDAGYEYLAGTINSPLKNQTTAEIGLKSVASNNYINRSLNEFKQYFPNINNKPLVIPVKIPEYNGPQSSQKLDLHLKPQVGMHLKVPMGATHLPKYIVDHKSNNENEYWMVVNNILRYKLGLYGDTNSNHSLGYGPEDIIEGQTGIGAQMERILKEYQTLSYKGIYFPQSSVVSLKAPTDPAASTKELVGDLLGAPGGDFSWENSGNNPLPDGVPIENIESTLPSDALLKTMQVPWAQNYGQEKLLLSLINGTFIAPTVLDAKLGSFNPMLVNSILYKYVNSMFGDIFSQKSPGYGDDDISLSNLHLETIKDTAKKLQKLPYHALALIANLNIESAFSLLHPAGTKPNPDFRYFSNGGVPQLYEKPEDGSSWEAVQNQDLKIDRFGQFWFNHMNVVEVQYLAGYEGIQDIPKSVDDPEPNKKRYEEVFNAAANAPIWQPLTVEKLQAINVAITQASGPGSGLHLLCRLVKKRCNIFNTSAYDALDLPLYDEHFLIVTQYQIEGNPSNAYIDGFPDEKISAGSPGLEISPGTIEGGGLAVGTALGAEPNISGGSGGLPTGKQAPTQGPESQDSPVADTPQDFKL